MAWLPAIGCASIDGARHGAAWSIRASRDHRGPHKAAIEKEDFEILKALLQSAIQYRTETTIANAAFPYSGGRFSRGPA